MLHCNHLWNKPSETFLIAAIEAFKLDFIYFTSNEISKGGRRMPFYISFYLYCLLMRISS